MWIKHFMEIYRLIAAKKKDRKYSNQRLSNLLVYTSWIRIENKNHSCIFYAHLLLLQQLRFSHVHQLSIHFFLSFSCFSALHGDSLQSDASAFIRNKLMIPFISEKLWCFTIETFEFLYEQNQYSCVYYLAKLQNLLFMSNLVHLSITMKKHCFINISGR